MRIKEGGNPNQTNRRGALGWYGPDMDGGGDPQRRKMIDAVTNLRSNSGRGSGMKRGLRFITGGITTTGARFSDGGRRRHAGVVGSNKNARSRDTAATRSVALRTKQAVGVGRGAFRSNGGSQFANAVASAFNTAFGNNGL